MLTIVRTPVGCELQFDARSILDPVHPMLIIRPWSMFQAVIMPERTIAEVLAF